VTRSSLKRNIYKLPKAMNNKIKRALILLGILVLTINCENSESDSEYPNCIETKINELKNSPVQNPPAEVWKWEVNNEVYYYVTSDCCDQFNILYNENCVSVCAPDGGITGNGDGNCPEFNNTIEKTLVWKDLRK